MKTVNNQKRYHRISQTKSFGDILMGMLSSNSPLANAYRKHQADKLNAEKGENEE